METNNNNASNNNASNNNASNKNNTSNNNANSENNALSNHELTAPTHTPDCGKPHRRGYPCVGNRQDWLHVHGL